MIDGKYHKETGRGKTRLVIDLAWLEMPLGRGYEVCVYSGPKMRMIEEYHPDTLEEGVKLYDALVKKYVGVKSND